MPELPEVETVRRGLVPALVGHRIVRVEQRRPDLRFPFPERFAARLAGARVEALDRRAKYIIARLDTGEALILHLGMTGRVLIGAASKSASVIGDYTHEHGGIAAHDHVVLHLETGAIVTYNDVRRFGFMDLCRTDALQESPHLAGLGIEPLGADLTPDWLSEAARGRRSPLKSFLLDQRIIAGLGNIYVCEALFRAGLDPERLAGTLAVRSRQATERRECLITAIRSVLEDAITAGGSTLRDYAHTDGSLGYFQNSFSVYDREGEPCVRPACRGIVRRKIQGGRSTFACPACQS
jgi:formamidopyrimidine-DNA glycosylase